jgi:hypothetical protein
VSVAAATTNGTPHMLSMALFYGGGGVRVFPVNGKVPLTSRGFHDATTDRATIEGWWAKWPGAGIATADFDVLDIDLYKPECEATWKRIKPLIPDGTPQTRTGGGGLQFLFKAGTLRDGKIGPGVDSRYAGRNYVVLPPSPHPSGNRYEAVVSVMQRRPKSAPAFPGESGTNSEFQHLREQMDSGEKITEGRNKAAWWRAVAILRTLPANTDLDPVVTLVQSWVEANCGGNLAEIDVEKQVRGAAKFVRDDGRREREVRPNRAGRGRELTVIPVSNAGMRSIRWLEKPLWQRAAFELLAGAKGAGKGTYLAGLAARLSTQGLGVLFITSEDSIEIDLKPRLVAAGADTDRVFVVREHVHLPDDVGELRRLAREIESLTLLVIDPVANHIGNRNSNSDAEVRDAIAPLNHLADELDCLLIGVRHPGKDRTRGAVASILGSTAWVDTPRAVVMVATDDVEDDVRHIQVVAGNRSRNGRAQSFRIEEALVEGLEEPVTIAVELGESGKSVDALLGVVGPAGGESRSAEAKERILDILDGEGEQESDALDARVARETGLAAKTVKNMRVALKNEGLIKAFPEKDEMGSVTRWMVFRTQAPRP